MKRFNLGAAVLFGAALIGAACSASAQPRYDGDRGDESSRAYGGDDRSRDFSDTREAYGREADRRDGDDHDPYRRGFDDRGGDGRDFRPARHYCWYESGWRGRGSYWCGYAWRRGYGWAGDNDRDYYYRGDHYRGYWEDGTGRRFYDRGGYGVGHDDDTRDYNPLRGS